MALIEKYQNVCPELGRRVRRFTVRLATQRALKNIGRRSLRVRRNSDPGLMPDAMMCSGFEAFDGICLLIMRGTQHGHLGILTRIVKDKSFSISLNQSMYLFNIHMICIIVILFLYYCCVIIVQSEIRS